MVEADATPASPDAAAARLAAQRILTAAWLAFIAGVGAQLLVFAVRLAAGGSITGAGFFAELAQGVSWSVLVCAAIAVGTLASKSRGALAGWLGLMAGPLAWAAAKGVQKGVQALAGVPQDQFTPLFWMVCGVKGLEYGALGLALSHLVSQPDKSLRDYLKTGVLLGAAGAAVMLALNLSNAAMAGSSVPAPRLASIAANELFFMSACSSVIYFAQALTRQINVMKG